MAPSPHGVLACVHADAVGCVGKRGDAQIKEALSGDPQGDDPQSDVNYRDVISCQLSTCWLENSSLVILLIPMFLTII